MCSTALQPSRSVAAAWPQVGHSHYRQSWHESAPVWFNHSGLSNRRCLQYVSCFASPTCRAPAAGGFTNVTFYRSWIRTGIKVGCLLALVCASWHSYLCAIWLWCVPVGTTQLVPFQ